MLNLEFPLMAQRVTKPTSIQGDAVLILGLFQWIRDTALPWVTDMAQMLHCCAVAWASPAALIQPLAWEFPLCRMCGPKKKKKIIKMLNLQSQKHMLRTYTREQVQERKIETELKNQEIKLTWTNDARERVQNDSQFISFNWQLNSGWTPPLRYKMEEKKHIQQDIQDDKY